MRYDIENRRKRIFHAMLDDEHKETGDKGYNTRSAQSIQYSMFLFGDIGDITHAVLSQNSP
jgi:hypothetical protein